MTITLRFQKSRSVTANTPCDKSGIPLGKPCDQQWISGFRSRGRTSDTSQDDIVVSAPVVGQKSRSDKENTSTRVRVRTEVENGFETTHQYCPNSTVRWACLHDFRRDEMIRSLTMSCPSWTSSDRSSGRADLPHDRHAREDWRVPLITGSAVARNRYAGYGGQRGREQESRPTRTE